MINNSAKKFGKEILGNIQRILVKTCAIALKDINVYFLLCSAFKKDFSIRFFP